MGLILLQLFANKIQPLDIHTQLPSIGILMKIGMCSMDLILPVPVTIYQ